MNTIERIEARHQFPGISKLFFHATPDEWAAIKAVVEAAILVTEDASVFGERSLGLVRDLGEALSKLEGAWAIGFDDFIAEDTIFTHWHALPEPPK